MLGAIYHGAPMVVVTLVADQFNARRAAELGVATALSLREADAHRLKDAAERALSDPELRATASALREECDSMDPIDAAVGTLERVGGERA